MNNLEELKIKQFKRVSEPRQHKIINSLGVYNAYKWIRKNKWLNIGLVLTEHLFYTIIRKVNALLAKDLILGKMVKFPHSMGRLELRKFTKKLEIIDGKLVTTLPIDWNRTLKLWAEKGKSKTLIRLEDLLIFRVTYPKNKANYSNKVFYSFALNREIKVALKNKIKNKQIDAYIL